MYLLLFIIHTAFILSTHFLGYFFLEWVFFISFLFFLLYFSPIFFSKKESNFSLPELNFSIKDSINLPIILFYIALYCIVFTLSSDFSSFFTFHQYIFISFYIILFGYIFWFNWKKSIFFDISRIHIVLSYITILASFFLLIFWREQSLLLNVLLILITSAYSYIFFSASQEEKIYLFLSFLFTILLGIFSIVYALFPSFTSPINLSILPILCMVSFEGIWYIVIFQKFFTSARIFFLIFLILLSIPVLFLSISSFPLIFLLICIAIFLFSVHIRYSNYVCFWSGIFFIYFIYTVIFISLLTTGSLLSALLFVFFLPLCIIGNTYFWDQRFEYDFTFLHYSSIAFSVIFSLYSIFFVPWWALLPFYLSLSLFLFWILSLLSYFRFTYK